MDTVLTKQKLLSMNFPSTGDSVGSWTSVYRVGNWNTLTDSGSCLGEKWRLCLRKHQQKAGWDLKTELAELAGQLFHLPTNQHHRHLFPCAKRGWFSLMKVTRIEHRRARNKRFTKQKSRTTWQSLPIITSNVNGLNSSDNIALLNKRANKNKPLYIPVKEITLATRIYAF